MGNGGIEGEEILFLGSGHFKLRKMGRVFYYEAVLRSRTMMLYRMGVFAIYWVGLYAIFIRNVGLGLPIFSSEFDGLVAVITGLFVVMSVWDVVVGVEQEAKEMLESGMSLNVFCPGITWLVRRFEGIREEDFRSTPLLSV